MTEAYLRVLSNSSGVPLAYAVRNDDNPLMAQEEFPSLKVKLVACTGHDGEGFAADNKQVWSIMQKAIMNGPGWLFLDSLIRVRMAGRPGRS